MKKLFLFFLLQVAFVNAVFCGYVDPISAKKVATNYYLSSALQSKQQRVKSLVSQQIQLKLVHQEFDDSISKVNAEPYYYVYNVSDNNGYIIVSADDTVTPVLAYSFEGEYDNSNLPPAFVAWMRNIKKQIKKLKTNTTSTLKSINPQWSKVIVSKTNQTNSTITGVAPLINTTWNQGCYYNTYCPEHASGSCGHVWVGCVAVAMGQIINYWKYPSACNEIPGYTDPPNYDNNGNIISNSSFGYISEISATSYNWSNMANYLTSTSSDLQKDAVAQLLFHCGVSVKMNYSLDGSGASSSDAAKALCKYFNYPASVQYKWKGDFSMTEWKALLTNELDHSRPMYYSGDSIGSHAFICDGYQNSDFFHFNWGWGGSSNGYFYIDNLTPSNYNFNNDQAAIIGISTVSLPIIQYINYNVIDGISIDGKKEGVGNGNGIVEPNETITFPITLKNIGYSAANNLTVVLSCTDTDISITNTQNLYSIAAGASNNLKLKFSVSTTCSDKTVELLLKINSTEGYWTKVLKVHVYKKSSVNVSVPGSLNTLFTTTEKNSITFLEIKGNIDARDFKAMRDNFPAISAIDLSGVTIAAYDGTAGPANVKVSLIPAANEPERTVLNDNPLHSLSAQQIMMQTKTAATTTYPANEIPANAFCNPTNWNGKLGLQSIVLPNSATSIGNLAFYRCTGLTSITIPSSVSSIGNFAFYSCTGLTSITIPSSVSSIGNFAFYYCNGLSSITIPALVTSIGQRAFYYCGLINVDNGNLNYSSQEGVLYNKMKTQLIQCPNLKTGSFSIPSSVTSIGNNAFSDCTGLTSITIPASVTSIGTNSFYFCSGLSSITIPASVISIGELAFYRCGLINVDNGNPNYSTQEGVLYDKMKTQIIQCPALKTGSFSIPLSVTSIGNYAFDYCTGLTSVTIPTSVTSIGNYTFYNCTGLTSITIPASVTTIGSYAFSYCTRLTSIYANSSLPINISTSGSVFYKINTTTCTLYVPQGSKTAYQAAYQWKDFTNIVENITSVSKTLQVNTAGTLASLLTANELATVTNLTLTGTIDARDFVTLRDAMPLMSSLDISGVIIAAYDGTAGPANVKVSSTSAINEPEKVELDDDPLHSLSAQHIKMQTKTTTSTTYPANEIPANAFCNPNTWVGKVSLKSIVLPNSITSIGSTAFYNCTGLTSITIPSLVTNIGSDAFYNCTGLTSITIPASVSSIGSWALSHCTGLTSITIPSSVSSIGDYALYYCAGLTSITIPVSVISIGDQAFYKCGLINVDNGNPNYSSQEGVLYNKLKTQIIQCPTVKTGSFSILNSVISIGISAFESCTGLTSITLPSSVSSIGNFAFYYCSGLSSITIPASVTSIGDQAFYKCGLINVDNGNPNYSSQEGVLYNKLKTQIIQCPTVKTGSFSIPNSVTLIGDYAFFYCNGLTSITIPVSVSSIGERTFYRCTGLTSITIPASVTTIGSYAFSYCTGLTSIYANPVTPVDLNNQYSVFYNINTTTCTLYVPQGSKAAYQAAYQWKDFTNIVEFTPAATETLLTNLEHPEGLCLNGDKIYLTETAARNTSYGGKLCLDKYDILTKQKTILKNNPICSDALVATNDNKLYLSSYVSSIPGQSGKISVYDLTSNIESLFLNIEIATEDMYLNTNGDMLIIGSSDLVDAKSIYKLAFGNYNSPIILKTGLGRVMSITESNNRIYFSSYMNIKYFDSDGIVQTLLNNHGAYSISCSQDYLYYADGVKNTIGRVHLSTMVDEVLLTNLNSPIAVRYDNSTNKLYFLESGTNSGLYKDGTLKVITITPTGIKNVTVNSISISPNPARSYLKVTTSEIINRIVVYDISGRIVQNIIVGTNSYKLNVSGLLNGIYLIKGFTDKGFVMGKFIKE